MATYDGRARRIIDYDLLLIATTQTRAAATSVSVAATSDSTVDLALGTAYDFPGHVVAVVEFPSSAVILSGGTMRIDLVDSSTETGSYGHNSRRSLYWTAAAGSSQLASGGAKRYYIPIANTERYVGLYFAYTYMAATAVKGWVEAQP